ncbi:homocysteine S-methyltransferase family protein [Fusibacter sp. 3D3]|uniref:homocysteine S-methyltransferase family protein n=1 Tax=Fusibacter sp. 3D3 TaxID=1048380 RepID=UPI000853AD5D|nr:homocysteine S-methyltransferase family protein [Fusibacter sp. 3D3]GAU78612.1 5-methyltetrahydrofolate-homocysteine methyltransferase [Fusibacter sp. 3D3]
MSLKSKIENEYLIFDGAMGTYLQKSGLKLGELPELLNFTKAELIEDIHLKYLEAGSDIITTNTLGANRTKLNGSGKTVEEVIHQSVSLAHKAIDTFHSKHHSYGESRHSKNHKYVALDLGPIGQLLEPMGTLSFDEAYDIYKEQVIAGVNAGCDLFLLETQTDLLELKCGVLACKENSDLPIIATMSFEPSGRTFTGTDVEAMVTLLEALEVDAFGFNCSFGPKEMLPLIRQALSLTHKPIVVQPNAGLPKRIDNITVYDTNANVFASVMKEIVDKGVTIIGGCCGTDESYIANLTEVVAHAAPALKRAHKAITRVSSFAKTVTLADQPIIIGERLNPTGKKRLKEALRNGETDYILREAISQVEQGASILDLNIGLPELDEAKLMPEFIKEIQSILDVPIQIDSSSVHCIEASARRYNGKPLINSVSGKEESLKAILPIVKRYGACILGLTLDDDGIPSKAEERFAIAEKIVNRAESLGIPRENVLIDCLALTASAQQEDVIETLKAIQLVKTKLGVKTVLGVSNVSFGLPKRALINKTFLTMALYSGLDAPILNPGNEEMMAAIDAYNVLVNNDVRSERYIARHSNSEPSSESKAKVTQMDLKQVILNGLKDLAVSNTELLLETLKPMEIVDQIIIPTLNEVGQSFESGKTFLPQLIQSAETVQKAFERLKLELRNEGGPSLSKGKIVLATVQHDVHDIGKNIVKVILQNYGYDVVDLGKDVPPERVLKACIDHNVKFVGLSALMTSTVESMAKTIQVLKGHDREIIVCVGGAVLNPEYAKMIHADFYAKDARETALIANAFFDKKG